MQTFSRRGIVIDTFEITVDGIPALAELTSYINVPPQGMWADSDVDCYGYTEMEYNLKDRKGYPKNGEAVWLHKIADKKDLWSDIDEQIEKSIEENTDRF